MTTKTKSDAERLESFVSIVPITGCWMWMGAISHDGYGRFHLRGKFMPAYRASYEIHRGPVPQELRCDHLCRNRWCVNPWHIDIVTVRENTLRGVGPASVNAKKTHCPAGHPLSGDNLHIVVDPRGIFRKCRICHLASKRRWHRKRKAMRLAALEAEVARMRKEKP